MVNIKTQQQLLGSVEPQCLDNQTESTVGHGHGCDRSGDTDYVKIIIPAEAKYVVVPQSVVEQVKFIFGENGSSLTTYQSPVNFVCNKTSNDKSPEFVSAIEGNADEGNQCYESNVGERCEGNESSEMYFFSCENDTFPSCDQGENEDNSDDNNSNDIYNPSEDDDGSDEIGEENSDSDDESPEFVSAIERNVHEGNQSYESNVGERCEGNESSEMYFFSCENDTFPSCDQGENEDNSDDNNSNDIYNPSEDEDVNDEIGEEIGEENSDSDDKNSNVMYNPSEDEDVNDEIGEENSDSDDKNSNYMYNPSEDEDGNDEIGEENSDSGDNNSNDMYNPSEDEDGNDKIGEENSDDNNSNVMYNPSEDEDGNNEIGEENSDSEDESHASSNSSVAENESCWGNYFPVAFDSVSVAARYLPVTCPVTHQTVCHLDGSAMRTFIGKGGYGSVFLGRLRESGEEVVVKEFNNERSSSNNIFAEALLLQQSYDTGFVPKCYGITRTVSGVAIVQEYYGGGTTLHSVIHNSNPSLSRSKWVGICFQLAYGLQLIHQKEVLPNDLKADNVLVDCSHPDSRIRFIDMGLAGHRRPKILRCPTNIRNSHYAPEVLGQHPTTTASDIYTLGHLFQHIYSKTGIEEIRCIAEPCLNFHPEQRPPIQNIITAIEEMLLFIE